MENRFPGGSWPVMLTPFTENNEVDYEGLKGTGRLVHQKWCVRNVCSMPVKRNVLSVS